MNPPWWLIFLASMASAGLMVWLRPTSRADVRNGGGFCAVLYLLAAGWLIVGRPLSVEKQAFPLLLAAASLTGLWPLLLGEKLVVARRFWGFLGFGLLAFLLAERERGELGPLILLTGGLLVSQGLLDLPEEEPGKSSSPSRRRFLAVGFLMTGLLIAVWMVLMESSQASTSTLVPQAEEALSVPVEGALGGGDSSWRLFSRWDLVVLLTLLVLFVSLQGRPGVHSLSPEKPGGSGTN